jgi:CheY-like chemotaxis protein
VNPAPHDVVFVVEDDPDTREALAEFVQALGHVVVAVENGKEALDLLRSKRFEPCVILLDIMMPVMNGWEFLAERRADRRLSAIPVVVISADPTAQARGTGPDVAEFLKKPIEIGVLSETLARHC